MSDTEKINFHYLKSNYFRVVRADGVYGGVAPGQYVFMAFFSERAPIPQLTVSPVNADGSLGEEIREERKGKDGIVREVEIGVTMNLPQAEVFHTWLGEKIEKLKQAGGSKPSKQEGRE